MSFPWEKNIGYMINFYFLQNTEVILLCCNKKKINWQLQCICLKRKVFMYLSLGFWIDFLYYTTLLPLWCAGTSPTDAYAWYVPSDLAEHKLLKWQHKATCGKQVMTSQHWHNNGFWYQPLLSFKVTVARYRVPLNSPAHYIVILWYIYNMYEVSNSSLQL